MDYSKIYIELIERSFERSIGGYTENHHIIPKCMGGDNESRNIAILTAEEHYLAHQLLVKIYPNNIKLLYSANMMSMNSNGNRGNNKLYGWLRRKLSESQIDRVVTDETRKKQSLAKLGKQLSEEHKQNIGKGHLGRKNTEETKAKMSKSASGKPGMKERYYNMGKRNKGRTLSDETKLKISASMSGKIPWNKGINMIKKPKIEDVSNLI